MLPPRFALTNAAARAAVRAPRGSRIREEAIQRLTRGQGDRTDARPRTLAKGSRPRHRPRMLRRKLLPTFGVAVLSAGASALVLWPLVSRLGSAVTAELDGAHYVWVLESGRQALARSPAQWF